MNGLYDRLVSARFGTYRGLIRLILATLEGQAGWVKPYEEVDLARVRRLVYVCLGNVCRSPYAEAVSKQHGIPSASLGLSTTTGMPAHPDGIEAARSLGEDLTGHIATDISDFIIEDGDLFLVMEIRQAKALATRLKSSKTSVQIALLGSWAQPRRLHIHDPITLSQDYFLTCYKTIGTAVANLAESYSRLGAPVHSVETGSDD